MSIEYTNYKRTIARTPGEQQRFVRRWWQIYSNELGWVPPYFPKFQQTLLHAPEHLARLQPRYISVQAKPQARDPLNETYSRRLPRVEQTLAAAILLVDPRRDDQKAYLGLLHSTNDPRALDYLLELAADLAHEQGCHHLLGPIGLTPHLTSGALQNNWDLTAPLHAGSNPHFIPALLSRFLVPRVHSYCYQIDPAKVTPPKTQTARFEPFDPARLAEDLLPLLQAACEIQPLFPAPDAAEAAFLVQQLQIWPLHSWLARVDGDIAGFILLQPDLAANLMLARGGRSWFWRLNLRWLQHAFIQQGRLLYAAVHPNWRERGIGRQLVYQAAQIARRQNWNRLTTNAIPVDVPTIHFLEHCGFRSQQRYIVYEYEV